jgi:hypothetical protein
MTWVADQVPVPRAVGMPRSLRRAAMACNDTEPAVCTSATMRAMSAARSAAMRALASWPALRAAAVSFAPARYPLSFYAREGRFVLKYFGVGTSRRRPLKARRRLV